MLILQNSEYCHVEFHYALCRQAYCCYGEQCFALANARSCRNMRLKIIKINVKILSLLCNGILQQT
jgi:hypothetical protein